MAVIVFLKIDNSEITFGEVTSETKEYFLIHSSDQKFYKSEYFYKSKI